MKPRLARLLTRLYPRPSRERYGAESEALLRTSRGGLRTSANVVWSALRERIIPLEYSTWMKVPGLTSNHGASARRGPCSSHPTLPSHCGLLCCLFHSVVWLDIFLPGMDTPFVRIDGFAIFYFGVGRLLYFGAPILIGWVIALIAARQKVKAVWPTIGLVLIALISSTAQVHASRPAPGAGGHVSMDLALGHSLLHISYGLFHALIILSLTALPYLIWRLHKSHSLSA